MNFTQQLAEIIGRVQNGLADAPGITLRELMDIDIHALNMMENETCLIPHCTGRTFNSWADRAKVPTLEAISYGLLSPQFINTAGEVDTDSIREYYDALKDEWIKQILALQAKIVKPAEVEPHKILEGV